MIASDFIVSGSLFHPVMGRQRVVVAFLHMSSSSVDRVLQNCIVTVLLWTNLLNDGQGYCPSFCWGYSLHFKIEILVSLGSAFSVSYLSRNCGNVKSRFVNILLTNFHIYF